MNNGCQKYNGCGADKEGGKIFNAFFYPEFQSKHVCPLAYSECVYTRSLAELIRNNLINNNLQGSLT